MRESKEKRSKESRGRKIVGKGSWTIWCMVLFLLTILQGCGSQQVPDKEQEQTSETLQRETEGTTESQTEPPKQSEPVVLTLVEEEIELTETSINFGDLSIDIPEGVRAEIYIAKDGSQAADLFVADLQYAVPHRIRLEHYTGEWEEEKGLINALLDLTAGERADCKYRYEIGKEYCYLISRAEQNCYALVRKQNIYLIPDDQGGGSDYSFGGLLYGDNVRWRDHQWTIGVAESSQKKSFVKCMQGDKTELFFEYDGNTRECFVYENRYYEQPIQFIKSEKEYAYLETKTDWNFDGYKDLYLHAGQIFLWNAETGQFEKAKLPEEFYPWYMQMFSETQSIWYFDSDYDEQLNMQNETEQLWKWEKNELVLQRECKVEWGEETIRIWAYEGTPDKVLFDETFSKEEWKKDSETVKMLYEQFYAGVVPAEAFYLLHEDNAGQQYIPQELLDKIEQAMRNGTELKTLKAMTEGRELSWEEICSLAREHEDIRKEVVWIEDSEWGKGILLEADGDNDGIKDLLLEEYLGGTAGFTFFIFFQGQEDGTFKYKSRYDHVSEEFAMINFEGKNYLCRTSFDYQKKLYWGFDLFCYEDGRRVEEVYLRLNPADYKVNISDCTDNHYLELAKQTKEMGLGYYAQISEYENVVGSAEQAATPPEEEQDDWTAYREDTDWFESDFNNDGDLELYYKYIWLCSNINTSDILEFGGDRESSITDILYKYDGGAPMMMWVTAYEGENIIHILYFTGLYDFDIVGYRLNGTDLQKLYCIEYQATEGVSVERRCPHETMYEAIR